MKTLYIHSFEFCKKTLKKNKKIVVRCVATLGIFGIVLVVQSEYEQVHTHVANEVQNSRWREKTDLEKSHRCYK